jgi:hypothetical protein
MLDFRAQTIHNQSAPANAGTKQLGSGPINGRVIQSLR